MGTSNKEKEEKLEGSVHKILANSYFFCFLAFLVGLFLDFVFPFKFLKQYAIVITPIGEFFLILATIIIFWAQKTSRHLKKDNIKKETFSRGPYYYTRTPTAWGLFFLTLGFGLLTSAFFVVISSFVSFFVSKLFFLKKQEEILAKKYGVPYFKWEAP